MNNIVYDIQDFSLVLKAERIKRGLSVIDCCKALNWKSRNNWYQYESGEKKPSIDTAEKMLAILGLRLQIRD